MTVTGHVEQLRASRCYQKSDSLSCTTCHDPHAAPPAEEQREHYRAACLACHDAAACRAAPERRAAQNQDDCSACHMPRSGGRDSAPGVYAPPDRDSHCYRPAADAENKAAATALVAVLDVSRLPEGRSAAGRLGLAYWRHHAENDDSRLPKAGQRAKELLSQVAPARIARRRDRRAAGGTGAGGRRCRAGRGPRPSGRWPIKD